MTQLREHRDDALEKLDPLGIARCGDQLANLQDIERGYTFHGFATSDLVVLGDIRGRPSAHSLRDVAHHRFRRAHKLIDAFGMASWHFFDELGTTARNSIAR